MNTNDSIEAVKSIEYSGVIEVECERQYAYLQFGDDRYFTHACCEKVENAALGVST